MMKPLFLLVILSAGGCQTNQSNLASRGQTDPFDETRLLAAIANGTSSGAGDDIDRLEFACLSPANIDDLYVLTFSATDTSGHRAGVIRWQGEQAVLGEWAFVSGSFDPNLGQPRLEYTGTNENGNFQAFTLVNQVNGGRPTPGDYEGRVSNDGFLTSIGSLSSETLSCRYF